MCLTHVPVVTSSVSHCGSNHTSRYKKCPKHECEQLTINLQMKEKIPRFEALEKILNMNPQFEQLYFNARQNRTTLNENIPHPSSSGEYGAFGAHLSGYSQNDGSPRAAGSYSTVVKLPLVNDAPVVKPAIMAPPTVQKPLRPADFLAGVHSPVLDTTPSGADGIEPEAELRLSGRTPADVRRWRPT